jgi:hypothetical protein
MIVAVRSHDYDDDAHARHPELVCALHAFGSSILLSLYRRRKSKTLERVQDDELIWMRRRHTDGFLPTVNYATSIMQP